MDTKVFPGADALFVTPQDEIAAEQPNGVKLIQLDGGGPADRKPLVPQIRVFGHEVLNPNFTARRFITNDTGSINRSGRALACQTTGMGMEDLAGAVEWQAEA
jgi:hypothetical protein